MLEWFNFIYQGNETREEDNFDRASGQAGLELLGAATMLSSLGSLLMMVLPNPVMEWVFQLVEAIVYAPI